MNQIDKYQVHDKNYESVTECVYHLRMAFSIFNNIICLCTL